jgi:hypothetical protein
MRAIGRGLRMPGLNAMAKEIGMEEDDLLIDHGMPSLTPHMSILFVGVDPSFCRAPDDLAKRRVAKPG